MLYKKAVKGTGQGQQVGGGPAVSVEVPDDLFGQELILLTLKAKQGFFSDKGKDPLVVFKE